MVKIQRIPILVALVAGGLGIIGLTLRADAASAASAAPAAPRGDHAYPGIGACCRGLPPRTARRATTAPARW